MADETPVAAATEQPEPTVAADKESQNVTSSNTESAVAVCPVRHTSADPPPPTENAIAPDAAKDSDAQADKAEAPADATTSTKDGEPAPAGSANGTPSASKNRRRSSGVTDKKLSRKKSQSRITHLDAKPGDYYLARLRSYAPWPAIICDEEMLPQSLLDSRPVTAAQPDGTYRADYADGGKRAHERTYPVMFFGTNEFAWITNTALTKLDPAECKEVSEKNKSKQLIGAYQVASEGHDLAYFKGLLADHQAAVQQENDELEAEEEAKAKAKAEKAASKKTKRKSKGAETDVEMEDADDSKKSKAAPKKRKKDAETDGEADKPAKTPKTATKLKLSTPKPPAEAKSTPASKTKKAPPKKGKAAAAAEEETKETKQPEKKVDPEELKKKKHKEVLFLRHKLQKGFISRDQPPKEDEMATMSTYFDKLEKHADLDVTTIRSTKINKVLKMIVKLNSIPRDEDFNFRDRSMAILSNWKHVLDNDGPGASTDNENGPSPNGAPAAEESAETPKLETEEEKEGENKASAEDTHMPDVDEAETADDKPAREVEKAEETPVEASA
ncbi:hypothetical protein N7468_005565 [Penicillium chermesinum]|uniref:PWWP domain-containing protein n=1 Tax=Penicillium chermesinum TaxID=63820 RepID=A0A9W9NZ98_9EURO|nr:uncharacterized protein N7468_005565 [Penicillium chermesinum]KAJ5232609.1 hypothetical protein N7468_005565 [Penicillium chermesinum]